MSSFRYYEIIEVMSGNPPTKKLALSDDGQPMGPDDLLIFNKKVDKMKRSENYRIRFAIKDFGNSRLRFVPVPPAVKPEDSDVMWAQRGTTCPDQPAHINDVIYVDKVDKNGEWIEVVNKDKVVETFWFTLNFSDKAIPNPTLSDYEPLDPGGSNQNHGEPLYEAIAACVVTGGLVGLSAIGLETGSFTDSNALTTAVGGAVAGLVVGLIADRM